jgi:Holliday junction resolvase RusA-like endonuclease
MRNKISSLIEKVEQALRGRECAPFALEIPPVPASRPRVGRWGVYYSKTYKAYRKLLEETIVKARRSFGNAPCAVIMEFVVPKPKTTKRLWPRGDGDNYEKALLDGLTQHANIWEDDDQVLVGVWIKRYAEDDEKPGTYATVWRLE